MMELEEDVSEIQLKVTTAQMTSKVKASADFQSSKFRKTIGLRHVGQPDFEFLGLPHYIEILFLGIM